MKTITLIFLILTSFVYTCSAQEKDLSYEIYKKQAERCGDGEYLKIFKYNREKVGWIDKIKNYQKDTIYFIEKDIYGIEAAQKYITGSMWRKGKDNQGEILLKINSYYRANINFKKSNEMYFGSYIMYLVNNWDIEQIKKEELGVKSISPSPMIATRIIIQNNCIHIDSICFDEFINIEMNNKYDSIIMSN